MCVYIYIYIYMHNIYNTCMHMCIYIYIQRERERDICTSHHKSPWLASATPNSDHNHFLHIICSRVGWPGHPLLEGSCCKTFQGLGLLGRKSCAGGTKRATSINMSPLHLQRFGGEIHNVSRNRARAQILLQAQKLHVQGSGTFGAFGSCDANWEYAPESFH